MNMVTQKRTQIFSKLFLILIFAVTTVTAFFILNNNSVKTVYASEPVVVNYIVDTITIPGSYYVSGELVNTPGAYEVGTFASSDSIIPAIDTDRIISGSGTELDPYVYMSCSIFFDSSYDPSGAPELDINSGSSDTLIPLALSNGTYELSGGFTDNYIVINNNANVILNGLTVIDDTYRNSFIKLNGGTLTVNDALLYITSSDNSGYYDETALISIIGSNSTVNINGGTLKTYMHFNTINILGDNGNYLDNVTLNINGGTFLAENKQIELQTNQTEGGIVYSNYASGVVNILGGTLGARIKSSLINIQEGDMNLTLASTVLNYENVLPYLTNELGGILQIGGEHGAIIYNGTGEVLLNEGIDFNIILDNFHFLSEDFTPISDSLFIHTNVIPVIGENATFDETIYIDFVFQAENEGTQTILTGSTDIATFKPYLTMLNYSFETDIANNGIKAKPNQFYMAYSFDYSNEYYYIDGIFGPWAKENTTSNIVTIPSSYTSFYGTKAVIKIDYKAFQILNNASYYDSFINAHLVAMTVLNLPTSITYIDEEAFKIDGGHLHIVNYTGTDAQLEIGVFDKIAIHQGEITQAEYEIMAELLLQFYLDMGTPAEDIETMRTEFYAYYSNALLGDSDALSGVLNVVGMAVAGLNYPLLFDGEAPGDIAIDVDPMEVSGGKVYLNYGVYEPIAGLDIITTSANYVTVTSQDELNTWKSYNNNFTYDTVVTFNTNGGSTIASINRLYNRAINYIKNLTTTDYAVDGAYTLTTPIKAGFTFTGWFSDELLIEEVTEETIITGNTLYAGWASKTVATITNIEDLTKFYDGEAVSNPTYDTLSDGQVTIEYYIKDGALLQEAPTEVGSYTVKIIVAETLNYAHIEEEADFTINMVGNDLCWLWILLLAILLLLLCLGGAKIYIDRRKKVIINNVTNNTIVENKTPIALVIFAGKEEKEDSVLDIASKKRKKREYGMNKKELIEAMALEEDLSKNASRKFIDAFQEVLVQELKKKNKVVLEGFVRFELVRVSKKTGINPLTQEEIKIKAHNDVRTKMSRVFKDKFNNK